MKVILSRKGFDSKNGRCPSPIFPNGRLYSFPISYPVGSSTTYASIRANADLDRSDMATVVEHLSKGRVSRTDIAHFDPDLCSTALPRLPGWRPCLGQAEGAQGHLANQGVGPGDLFLFFGWFREIEWHRDRWRYKPRAPNLHILFGWLQVGEVIDIHSVGPAQILKQHPWIRDHPHPHIPAAALNGRNVVYVASDRLYFGSPPFNSPENTPGGGVFSHMRPELTLTASESSSRSLWRLPAWFKGDASTPFLSCHENPARWKDDDGSVLLRSVPIGQEFVLDCCHKSQSHEWLTTLFAS